MGVMMSDFHTLLNNMNDDTTGTAIQWSAGHMNIFVHGTFANTGNDDDDDDDDDGGQNYVAIEVSADGSSFVPVDDARHITREVSKYLRLTGHCYVRARFEKVTGSPSGITVKVM